MSTELLNPCETGRRQAGLERTRFFERQLVTPDDLTQDQVYFREKHRRHNRMLHGWGVVCGACVRRGAGECEVVVEPGYILGPWGDEIVIPDDVTVDVCRAGRREQIGCCEPSALDPWCDDGPPDCPQGTVYLAIRYAECDTRPVRALQSGCGCGCDESACQHSRIRDGYAIAVLPELPPTYTTPLRQPTLAEVLPPCSGRLRRARPCPPCPESPWVILADVAVDRRCRIIGVDCFAHRRNVVSFATFYFACAPGSSVPVRPIPGAEPGPAGIARHMAILSGSTDLVDLEVPAGGAPRAAVAMSRPDGGTVAVPAFFEVRSGETAAELLEREGDRAFYDPVADDTITLRELFTAADVSGDTTFTGTASALAPLEGRTLTIGIAREQRAVLQELLTAEGLQRFDREMDGRIDRASELPATVLMGVSPRSTLGQIVHDMTIADLAGRDRGEFVGEAVEAASDRQKKQVETQARQLWEAARRVNELGR